MTLPAKCFLLDIEGTTSSISFVHDVMFPFVLEHLPEFLDSSWDEDAVQSVCQSIAQDAGHTDLDTWAQASGTSARVLVEENVQQLMAQDVKATGLKALQGLIWRGGFESGQLKAHIYPDVIPAIQQWITSGADVRIYSSGSIAAQKLFFGHLEGSGNCLELFFWPL